MVIVPSLIVTRVPSMPSCACVLIVPPSIVTLLSPWMASSPDSIVMLPELITITPFEWMPSSFAVMLLFLLR